MRQFSDSEKAEMNRRAKAIAYGFLAASAVNGVVGFCASLLRIFGGVDV